MKDEDSRWKLVRGELRPGGTEREWCDPDVLRRLRRASLATLRREVEALEATQEELRESLSKIAERIELDQQ